MFSRLSALGRGWSVSVRFGDGGSCRLRLALRSQARHDDGVNEPPYSRFEREELILRDELAIDRTLLANERTLLAYLRSAISLGIAGISIMHFSAHGWYFWSGVACLPAGVLAAGIGIVRHRRMNARFRALRASRPPLPPVT